MTRPPRRLPTSLALALMATTACLLPPGCAPPETVGDIDRTQANLVAKSHFEGQWYYRPVVVDVPYHVGFTFVGNTGGALQTPRIVWDVREDTLWAYQVHAGVSGADERWRKRQIRQADGTWIQTYAGPPVAAFPIQGHFDVIRPYNSSTGEQQNILIEDASERPWYEREFIRVDWSSNTITDFLFLTDSQQTGAAGRLNFYPQEHQVDDPNAAEIEDGRVSIVQNVFTQAEGLGRCSTYNASESSCAPGTLKIRLDFMQVPHWREYTEARAAELRRVGEGLVHEGQRVTRTYDDFVAFYYYAPAVHDDFDQEKFGFFRTERNTYDPDRGPTWDGRTLLRNRWNLWQRIRPAQVVPTLRHPTPAQLPYRERRTRQITYFVNADYPDELWTEARAVADGWDGLFRNVVAWLRFHEEYPEVREAECEKVPGLSAERIARCKRDARSKLWRELPGHWSREADRVRRLIRVYEWQEGSRRFRDRLSKGDGYRQFVREMLGEDPDDPNYEFPLSDGDEQERVRAIVEVMDTDGLVRRFVDDEPVDIDTAPDVQGVPRIFATCHTPVRPELDGDECLDPSLDPEGLKKIGDLRWSFMYWIAEAQSSSPLGYGPSAADPISGEIFNGTAYVYGAPMETLGTYALDLVKLIQGELDISTIISGDNVELDVLGRKRPDEVRPPLNFGDTPRPSGLPPLPEGFEMPDAANPPPFVPEFIELARNPVELRRLLADAAPRDQAGLGDRLERLRGTYLEDMLLTDEVVTGLTGGQVRPGDSIPAHLREQLSLAEWASPEAMARQRDRERILAENSILMADSLDESIIGLAKEMTERRPQFKLDCQQEQEGIGVDALERCADGKTRLVLLGRWYRGVMEHEVGHTVGLRHNFEGSVDVPNFDDEWMHIKDRHGTSDLRPLAPTTAPELEDKLLEYRYSTVMDYGGKINSDIHGLGKYDRAALLYGYGDFVEVYAEPEAIDGAGRFGTKDTLLALNAGLFFHPYSALNDLLGGFQNNRRRVVVPYEHVRAEALRLDVDERTLLEVPYRFGSDEYRGNYGNYTWDAGVDPFEIAENAANNLQNYYFFDAFKRDRFGFGRSPQSYFDRVRSRHMSVFGDLGRYFALFNRLLRQQYPPQTVEAWLNDANQGGPLYQGMVLGLRKMASTLASPAPGSYALDAQTNVWRHLTDSFLDDADLTVPIGTGRFPLTSYTRDDGYYFYEKPQMVGAFWEKLAAILTLTDSSANFQGEYLEEIGGGTSIGFNTYLMAELNDLLGSIIAGDLGRYAPLQQDGAVAHRDFLADQDQYAGASLVEPSLNNFTMKLYSAVYAMAYLPAGYDQSIIDSLFVHVRGESGGYEPDEDQPTVRFTDPFSRKVYTALRPDFDDDRIPIAERLVRRGGDLSELWRAADEGAEKDALAMEIRSTTELLDQLRTLRDLFGHVGGL